MREIRETIELTSAEARQRFAEKLTAIRGDAVPVWVARLEALCATVQEDLLLREAGK